ncbi:MAG: hypothetical protein Q9215_004018 [Flavoplaca cf. flavocitrina]
MGFCRRPWILEDCLDKRVVKFADHKHWQLTKKLHEKPWEGTIFSERGKREDWQPDEAHAVYEWVQTVGPEAGQKAIMKIRLEVPHFLPLSDDPEERAKDASGMRLNSATKNEIENLGELTAAGCSVTPSLLGYKIETQDSSILSSKAKPAFEARWGRNVQWWMPGGYIVYILMTKIDAQPLDINTFWDKKIFSKQQRDEGASKTWLAPMDERLENLMWDKKNRKCYIIDLETMAYDIEFANPAVWEEGEYFMWNLARKWATPNWWGIAIRRLSITVSTSAIFVLAQSQLPCYNSYTSIFNSLDSRRLTPYE